MKATEILSSEHRVIEQVLGCLEKMTEASRREGRLDPGPAHQAIHFLRSFADACHHGKEEDELFPLLEARGLSRVSGPTAVMRAEHAFGRDLLAQMERAVGEAAEGRAASLTVFGDCAREYARFLREHIDREDRCLFPIAAEMLEPRAQEQLLERFERVEREEHGSCHAEGLRLAAALGERFGVPRPV